MATRQRSATATTEERTRTFDLRAAFGLGVPETAREVTATTEIAGSSYRIRVERKHEWLIEGTERSASVTGVHNDHEHVELPETVPNWLWRVLDALECVSIREVSIYSE